MQRAGYSVAFRTPVQAAASCGSFQRNPPTGGAAYGMPLKVRTFPSALITPSKTPLAVRCSTARTCARDAAGQSKMPIKQAHWPAFTRIEGYVSDIMSLIYHTAAGDHTDFDYSLLIINGLADTGENHRCIL